MRFRRSSDSSRVSRLKARKTRRRFPAWLLAVLTVTGIALVVAGGVAVAKSRAVVQPRAAEKVAVAAQTVSTPSTAGAVSARMVEVPSLVGLGMDEARVVLESAGLVVSVREAGAPATAGEKRLIASQEPAAGTVSEMGDTVRLVVPPATPASSSAALPAAKKPSAGRFVVCIDPGHQAHSDSTPEPIGPGATQTKPSVSGGATGVSTGIPEYEIALQIAMNLKKRLEAAGIKVVMTRTTSDVNVSNSRRAQIANKSGADLFVRIHGDGSPKSSTVGISSLYPASNTWTKPIASDSRRAADAVQRAIIRTTGAVDRGTVQRSDLSGFNWAKVPSVLVEAGFLSNPVEDKLLASPHYQDKLAQGMSQGIQAYLNAEGR